MRKYISSYINLYTLLQATLYVCIVMYMYQWVHWYTFILANHVILFCWTLSLHLQDIKKNCRTLTLPICIHKNNDCSCTRMRTRMGKRGFFCVMVGWVAPLVHVTDTRVSSYGELCVFCVCVCVCHPERAVQ